MRLSLLQRIVLFEQTVYGLPWMALGGILPIMLGEVHFTPASLLKWTYMILAFIFARIAGMCFNRFIDRHIDALNPRTRDRTIALQSFSEKRILYTAFFALAAFILICSQINTECCALSLIAGLLITLYSYTKRFTYLCHFVLGSIHFLAPVCAWLAIGAPISLAPLLLGLAAGLSIAANDIIYAIQDYEFDKQEGIFSFPSQYGVTYSVWTVRALHILVIVLLIVLGRLVHFHGPFYVGIACLIGLYSWFHLKLTDAMDNGHISLLYQAFASVNKWAGLSMLTFTLTEYVWRAL